MASVEELIHAHAGRPAFVLGGGPSLPKDFKQCPKGAVLISGNYHGCIMTRCDYVVSIEHMDETHAKLREYETPIVSPHRDADYRIDYESVRTSGMEAARTAWILGCAPIVLGGMDLYQGAVEHFHRPERKHTYGRDGPGPHQPRKLPKQLDAWRAMRDRLVGSMFRVVSGPLSEVFPRYRPHEARAPVATPNMIAAVLQWEREHRTR